MIELADFKNEWEQLFNDFRDKIFSDLSGIVKEIEHIGSTSINDMKAKDIIDVQVGKSVFLKAFIMGSLLMCMFAF